MARFVIVLSFSLSTALEYIFQSELNQTWIHRSAGDLSETAQIVKSCGRIAELGMIEDVEEFSPELQVRVLVDATYPRNFRQRGIEVKLAGPEGDPYARVSPARAVGNLSIWSNSERNGSERRGIEIAWPTAGAAKKSLDVAGVDDIGVGGA
jgi:hypothetical protein